MDEYILKTAAMEIVRRTSGDYAAAFAAIRKLPAADVAPVVHGRWTPCTESEITGWDPNLAGRDPLGGYFCSICHYEAIFSCNDEYVLSDYCPSCGAKMDGKGEKA